MGPSDKQIVVQSAS